MAQHDPHRHLAQLDRWFRLDMPFARFLLHVLVVSLAGLVPVLALYVALAPGFTAHLAGDAAALGRFARQIVTNGLPVVVVVNFVGFVLFAARGRRGAVAMLCIDLVARAVAFVGLHAVIYPASALWFDSFGGDPSQALRVMAPTLTQAALFGNLSGVYLYAAVLGAAPLVIAVLAGPAGAGARRAPLAYLPFAWRMPALFALAMLAYVALVAALVTLIAHGLAG